MLLTLVSHQLLNTEGHSSACCKLNIPQVFFISAALGPFNLDIHWLYCDRVSVTAFCYSGEAEHPRGHSKHGIIVARNSAVLVKTHIMYLITLTSHGSNIK